MSVYILAAMHVVPEPQKGSSIIAFSFVTREIKNSISFKGF